MVRYCMYPILGSWSRNTRDRSEYVNMVESVLVVVSSLGKVQVMEEGKGVFWSVIVVWSGEMVERERVEDVVRRAWSASGEEEDILVWEFVVVVVVVVDVSFGF